MANTIALKYSIKFHTGGGGVLFSYCLVKLLHGQLDMDWALGLSKRGAGSGGARVGRGQKVAVRPHMEGVSRGQEGGPGGAEDTWSTSSSLCLL